MEMKSHMFLKGTTGMLKENLECSVLRLVNVLF